MGRKKNTNIIGIVGHNSYFGCQRCMIRGSYSNNKMSFPRIAATDREREEELRTDENFRIRFQQEHHKEFSIIEELPINMVTQFPTSEELHLFELGIIKR